MTSLRADFQSLVFSKKKKVVRKCEFCSICCFEDTQNASRSVQVKTVTAD